NTDVTDVPFYVIPEPIDLCRSDADVNLLLRRIGKLPPLALIEIDTVSRTMNGGNENAPDDMGRFVAHCDKLRLATTAHVLAIHHSGKDEARGARGHSLLKAACDTEIEVAADDATDKRTATVVKQRDHRTGDVFGFSLRSVDLDRAVNGEAV